ncbi:hypothetical protein PPERSA_01980 [Pseudocohnilembus persalinus]|uniref:LITAF domain-containing protein n=1 Tax=Pseudocohnilembus persalinus TaxID=266149 RepID=A0A0V0QF10_PSEPJ|nr:hypothetical protein PPERSA_01980 [Pseudocohnilembus persalinus]|eukprot:KRX00801.1 hypothetical protein PPERSA_01980 [Pseudocohnilembus persalinus]
MSDSEEEFQEEQEISQKGCPHCGSRSEPIFDKQPSKATFILSIISLIALGFYSILVIPLIIQATKTVVKKCYDCNQAIEYNDLFSIPSFNDQVLNFRFGSCALILSRKYAYVLLAVAILGYFLIGPSSDGSIQAENEPIFTDRTWLQYVDDCGKDVFISNGVRAKANYNKHYLNKIINWEGAFYQIREQRGVFSTEYGLYIKMNPTDSAANIQDIILILDSEIYEKYKKDIKNLKQGDILQFQGIISHMGDEYSYHVIQTSSIKFTKTNIDIDKIPTVIEYKLDQESI